MNNWPEYEKKFYKKNFYAEATELGEEIGNKICDIVKITQDLKPSIQEGIKIHQQYIVSAGTQSGKTQFTGAMAYFISEELKRTIGIDVKFVLCGTPLVDLQNQTFNTLSEDFDLSKQFTTNNSGKSINNYLTWQDSKDKKHLLNEINKWRKEGKTIVFIYDECDAGTGKDKKENGDISNLRQTFEEYSIPLCGIKSKYPNREFGVMITATLSHLIEPIRNSANSNNPESCMSKYGYPLYAVYARYPGDNYQGHDDLFNQGYFRQGFKITKKNYAKLFSLLTRKIKWMHINKDFGYIVIRNTRQQNVVRDLLKSFSDKIKIENIDSKTGNIKELPAYLKEKPDIPTIYLIKEAAKRGIQIPVMEYIHLWFDTLMHDAGNIQSTGRFCGYNKTYHNQLEIYCHKKALEEHVPFYEAAKKGTEELRRFINDLSYDQSSTHNNKKKGKRYRRTNVHVFDSKQEAHAFNSRLLELNPESYFFDKKGKIKNVALNTVSENNGRDVAAALIDNSERNNNNHGYFHNTCNNGNNAILNAAFHNPTSMITKKTKYEDLVPGVTKVYQFIYVDKANQRYIESWKLLDPSLLGKFVITEAVYLSEYSYDNTADWPIA